MISYEFSISNTHPCLEGHFPGDPIVPGVVIVDEVMQGLLLKKNTLKITHLTSVKFLKVIKANQTVQVNMTEKKPGYLQFECFSNDLICASGKIRTHETGEL